jgi:predicted choloylglycine hydrolase
MSRNIRVTVPAYTIDLDEPESSRWGEVIAKEKAVAVRLVEEAAKEFGKVPEILRWVFAHLYQVMGGLYQDEIAAWSDGLSVTLGTATMLNCAYELSHLRWPKLFGCTAGVRFIEGIGMVHVRTLDWPLPSIADATRLFQFRRGSREFVVVGACGHVGVLSGMLPGAYSVTINWAPPAGFPTFDFGPTFLLRDTLEKCDTFDAVVKTLCDTRLSTSVFFTICGAEKGQACVIERTQREAMVRHLTNGVVAQANHHVAQKFVNNNKNLAEVEEESFEGDSVCRIDSLAQALKQSASCSFDELAELLNRPPVLNQYTCQQMIFCPATGTVRVWPKKPDATSLV